MSYQVFARKYRPRTFKDVLGQDHVVQTLCNAIEQNRLAHAYLFVGPRGTGKTSTARIFAKALNCSNGPRVDFNPDEPTCLEIAEGRSLDVLEIDGASNRGIDNIRDLRDNAQFRPTHGQFRIIYIDEVHMLTKESFNALLKTLEEPPPHVKFIFATTEPHKILPTILSRCQRFDLRPIPADVIAKHLVHIAAQEGVSLSPEASMAIARVADGGMRDAQSMLDQLVSFCGMEIVEQHVNDVFGVTNRETVARALSFLLDRQLPSLLHLLHEVAHAGNDMGQLLNELMSAVRELLVSKVVREHEVHSIPAGWLATLQQLMERTPADKLIRVMELLAITEERLRWSSNKRLHLEMGLIQAVHSLAEANISDIVRALNGASLPETPIATSCLPDITYPTAATPAPTPAPEPVVEVAPVAIPTPAPEPVVEVAPVAISTPAPEPVVEVAPVAISTPAPEPVVEVAPVAISTPAPEPVVEVAPVAIPTPAPEPVVEVAPAAISTPAPERLVDAVPTPTVNRPYSSLPEEDSAAMCAAEPEPLRMPELESMRAPVSNEYDFLDMEAHLGYGEMSAYDDFDYNRAAPVEPKPLQQAYKPEPESEPTFVPQAAPAVAPQLATSPQAAAAPKRSLEPIDDAPPSFLTAPSIVQQVEQVRKIELTPELWASCLEIYAQRFPLKISIIQLAAFLRCERGELTFAIHPQNSMLRDALLDAETQQHLMDIIEELCHQRFRVRVELDASKPLPEEADASTRMPLPEIPVYAPKPAVVVPATPAVDPAIEEARRKREEEFYQDPLIQAALQQFRARIIQ